MKASVKVGKAGLSPEFLAGLGRELEIHELVKVKFEEFKDQKKIGRASCRERVSRSV
jgi:RNA-binding protein YhbY